MANDGYIKKSDAESALLALRKGYRKAEEKCAVYGCILEIQDLPTVDAVEVVHGRWHDVYMSSPTTYTGTCSACGVTNDIPHPWRANYCPNCGAKMDKEATADGTPKN